MSVEGWEWLIGIAIAVVFGGGAILATRAWGTRRRRVLVIWDATPLLPTGQLGSEDLIKVMYGDHVVHDPDLVTIRVKNVGPVDVARAHFDGGQDLVVKLNCVLYGLTSTTHPHNASPANASEAGSVRFSPFLLKRRDEWGAGAIVSGPPQPELDSPLIDTDVTLNSEEDDPLYAAFFRLLGRPVLSTVINSVIRL